MSSASQPHRSTAPASAFDNLTGDRAPAARGTLESESAPDLPPTLDEGEARYRALFNSMGQGFCIIEVLFDADGKPEDYRFLEANAAFEQQTGLHDAVGKTMRALAPEHEQHWFDTYGRIARTGEPARFGHEARALGRWFDVHAFRIGEPQRRQVAILFEDISEQRRAEVARRESEARFRLLGETLPLIISLAGPDGQIEYVNPYWESFSGRTAEDFASGDWLEAVHPDDREAMLADWQHALAEGEPYEYEFRARAADGIYRWLLARGRPFHGTDGRILHWVNVATEIHERKEAEEVRRRAAECDAFRVKLADALRALADPIEVQAEAARVLGKHLGASRVNYGEVDPDDRHMTVAREYLTGGPSVVGRVLMDDFGSAVVAALRAGQVIVETDIAASPALTEAERAAYAAIGAGAYVAVPLIKDGRFVASLAVHTPDRHEWTDAEITLIQETAERTWATVERARAEAALRESEEWLTRIVENNAEGVVTISPEGRFLSINAAGERILGVERDQLLGRSSADPPFRRLTLSGEPLGEVPAIPDVAASGATVFRHEYQVERKDGTRIVIARSVTAVRAADGTFLGAVSTFSDITARRQMEEARGRLLAAEQVARQEAEAANRAKDEFLSTLSHELRTPLTPILGFTQMLQRGPVDGERLRLALETIDRSARTQARLVNDLLDVSRIISGKLPIEMAPTDLRALVQLTVDAAWPAATARRVSLTATLDPLPGAVLGDVDRLRQVVDNLLTNAVKFTPPGGRVEVRLTAIGEEARITVADTGAGISAEFLPHVFERFRQADGSTTRAHGGLGLGLAIVRYLVEQHGGSVTAESAGEERGATFTVRLPLAAPSPQADGEDGGTGRDADGEARRLAGVRVLVVDDDAGTRAMLRLVLEDAGATVVLAASSAEGLAVVEAARPDVLLADIGMADEDGYQFLATLRAREAPAGRTTPAVAVTAYVSAEDRRRALAAGFARHLAKPVDAGTVVATVSELAGARRAAGR